MNRKQETNLPLALYTKHQDALGLTKPLVVDNEQVFFEYEDKTVTSAVVFLPKSKALIDMTLSFVSNIVSKDGTIILAGEKKAGIESAKKLYEATIGPVEQKIVGNHSALYVGKNKKLSTKKSLNDFLSYSPLIYRDTQIEVANLPGVFSAGELDAGTKLLLEHIPYDKKKVLDVGSGAGVIGAIYKKLNPESDVTLSDASKLAVFASEKTLEKNNLEGTILESDVFSNISGKPASTRGDSSTRGGFDLILTNPPFHNGIETDYTFIEKFARDAKKYLNPGGEVFVVANSFLSYQNKLEAGIGPTEIIVDDGKFRVFKSKFQ